MLGERGLLAVGACRMEGHSMRGEAIAHQRVSLPSMAQERIWGVLI
jgi:hypothetical protein